MWRRYAAGRPGGSYHRPITEVHPHQGRAAGPRDHVVQVYRDPFDLAEAVATFFAAGFEAGEPAILVATAANRPLIAERLRNRGWDADALEATGLLAAADAETTLEAILDDGALSFRRFSDVIGALLDGASGASPGKVRVFGEMVDILCRRGEASAADELEHFWNRLGSLKDFALLCGYRLDLFDRDAQVALLPRMYRAHSHVLAGADVGRVEAAVEAALTEILGATDARKVFAQVERHNRNGEVPRAHLALMWVSAHMPRTAERILGSARSHYLDAGAGAVAAT